VLIQPSTFAVPYKFTGKERDPESGLDDFDARFYSSPFGRFMTPDWEAKPTDVPYANFGNPQSLNLYSYVQNNPTTTGDPDGHECDACATAMNFLSAAANAWTSDNALGAGRQTQTTETGRIGAAVGDFGATVTGGVETLVGGGGNVGGLALDLTGGGAVLGVPINVAATGLMLHGGGTTAAGFYNLFKQGGTYTRRDDDNKVQRSGRTNDLDRRQGEHARAEETKDLKFKTELKTNSKAAQRGHEQMLHDQHQPPLNKVQPISPNNPNKAAYMKAAKKRLKNN
jgi:RHS repeat-associated protein